MSGGSRLRVLPVGDAARPTIWRWLRDERDLDAAEIVAAGDGAAAAVARARPDVIVLDAAAPEALDSLPSLLQSAGDVAVVVALGRTARGEELVALCLALGAAAVLVEPEPGAEPQAAFRRRLVATVRSFCDLARRRAAAARRVSDGAAALAGALGGFFSAPPVRAVAIGASTGGPQAIAAVLRAIAPAADRVPVLVAQPMPAHFAAAFAARLAAATGLTVRVAADGEAINHGVVYLAPPGRIFTVEPGESGPVARVAPASPDAPRPFDALLRSAADAYGSGLAALALTGLGEDGAAAAPEVSRRGGRVIAQDQATSVAWEAPRAVIASGACAEVLPLGAIGPRVAELIGAPGAARVRRIAG